MVSSLRGLKIFLFTSPSRLARGNLAAWFALGLTSTVPIASAEVDDVPGEI